MLTVEIRSKKLQNSNRVLYRFLILLGAVNNAVYICTLAKGTMRKHKNVEY